MTGETTNLGDVTGPVISGTASGPVGIGGSVMVTVQQAAQTELPPELQNATLRQMVVGLIDALQGMEARIYETAQRDAKERRERQLEADAYRARVEQRLERIDAAVNRSLWTSAAALCTAVGAFVRGETRQ